MDNCERPIGVFDSGLGGLTVVKEILKNLPNENIIFFGDTGRVPYGGRSKETITQYVKDDMDFLLSHGVKAVVIACNTADSMARETVENLYNIPIIGVVSPAAKKAANATKNGRIGVIGTKATVKSGAYLRAISAYSPETEVFVAACPLLVPLVEEGRFQKGDIVPETVLKEYLEPLKEKEIDTLILGCTHYPLLYDIVASILPDVQIICSGPASTEALIETLSVNSLLNRSSSPGSISYFVSDSPDSFSKNGSIFIGKEINSGVKLVNL
ncbi:MAG: glutamate racemase [Oscillospiraceae bacterium]|nr:glutamate racemase [Oscillospiraceae bacterium]